MRRISIRLLTQLRKYSKMNKILLRLAKRVKTFSRGTTQIAVYKKPPLVGLRQALCLDAAVTGRFYWPARAFFLPAREIQMSALRRVSWLAPTATSLRIETAPSSSSSPFWFPV